MLGETHVQTAWRGVEWKWKGGERRPGNEEKEEGEACVLADMRHSEGKGFDYDEKLGFAYFHFIDFLLNPGSICRTYMHCLKTLK